jgi:hypothetical protein
MRKIPALLLAAAATVSLAGIAPGRSQAQVAVSVGAAPQCQYGYFDYAPYSCSPDGYYGPQFFERGVFVGVGPWFHGTGDFHGTVNNRYDPQHGYKEPAPTLDPPANHVTPSFQGNEERDGRGHVVDTPAARSTTSAPRP